MISDNVLLTLPVLIPMLAGVIAFLIPKKRIVQVVFNVASSFILLVSALMLFCAVHGGDILSITFGGWDAPFGIVFVADILSAAMVLVTAFIAFVATIYAYADIDGRRYRYGFVTFFQFMFCGINGAFLTGDIFNLYVWFEVMLITSFALLSLGNEKIQLYGTLKYIALNLIATVLFLSAIGMLYGATGTLNMADLAIKLPLIEDRFLIDIIAVFFIVAFGIKSAVFPLFFWLPASYHLPPVTVSAIFAGLLTKVGVYALIRIFTLIFTENYDFTQPILLWIAALTMVVGGLSATIQKNTRRILSFHIISQIGYMIMGLALLTAHALAGAVFYIVHHIIVKANLFFISGIMARKAGGFYIGRMGGLYVAAPFLSFLFIIAAFSLAGFPPLSGFWSKFLVVNAGLLAGNGWIVLAALIAGMLTIISMAKIWVECFWKPYPGEQEDFGEGLREQVQAVKSKTSHSYINIVPPYGKAALYVTCALLAAVTISIGLAPSYLVDVADRASIQLMTPSLYIDAVLTTESISVIEALSDGEG